MSEWKEAKESKKKRRREPARGKARRGFRAEQLSGLACLGTRQEPAADEKRQDLGETRLPAL